MSTHTLDGWHFAAATLRDGRPLPKRGDILTHDGPVVPCESGLHMSVRAIDALTHAPGAMVARVRISGEVVAHGNDKWAASRREMLTDYVDATRVLHEFGCWCATNAMDVCEARGVAVDPRSRNAVVVKRRWLDGKATAEDLAAARDAAWDPAWAAARAAARDAARAAAWAAAWAAARDAARAAAWDAAWAAARAAARDASWDAAWDAASDAQNTELERMLSELVGLEVTR